MPYPFFLFLNSGSKVVLEISKKKEKIFVVGIAVLVILSFFYFQRADSLLNLFVDEFSDVNWDELKNRDIVKNSIPIVLLETIDRTCKVTANNFDLIIDHQYFIRADELAKKLNYDRNDETVILPCEMLYGDKSRLNVWYVIEEASSHSKKYQFFVTPWENETQK